MPTPSLTQRAERILRGSDRSYTAYQRLSKLSDQATGEQAEEIAQIIEGFIVDGGRTEPLPNMAPLVEAGVLPENPTEEEWLGVILAIAQSQFQRGKVTDVIRAEPKGSAVEGVFVGDGQYFRFTLRGNELEFQLME